MKRAIGMFLAIGVLCISGCAILSGLSGSSGGKNYSALAKEKSFNYFFPVPTTSFYFANLDEAYDFVNTAQAKFTSSSGKSKAKGLAAKLKGPKVIKDKPVTVCYFMEAWPKDGNIIGNKIDLTKINKPLETVIKEAVSVTLVFMVFYQDRGISLSNFHLQSGWTYDSNSQFKQFNYNNAKYDADYPVAWNINKAFSYLRKEIN